MRKFGKDELKQILLEVDEEVSLLHGVPETPYRVVIVGGSAFLLSDLTSRAKTHDIDVLWADDPVRELLFSYGVANGSVSAYESSLPYNFEDRLVDLNIPSRSVKYMTPSLEDLVVMKLYAWRPNDIADLKSEETLKRIDWSLLDRLVYADDEAKASSLSEFRYAEMTSLYERFKEEASCE